MGDLQFVDPAAGTRLLVVHTTPPGLTMMSTELDDEGRPRNESIDTISLCNNPNMLAVDRPDGEEPLAFVSCYGSAEVAVVSLTSFARIRNIAVDEGPNEMVVDSQRRLLYVANTLGDTLSIVGLDRSAAGFLRERARLGIRPR
jgi:DNA-binding beta-propeller fold protein YncE